MNHPIVIDPRPATLQAMIELLQANAPVVGIKVIIPELLPYLAANIAGQHREDARKKAAIELALEVSYGVHPDQKITFAVACPDLDTVGALAVLDIRFDIISADIPLERRTSEWLQLYRDPNVQERIHAIARMGTWSSTQTITKYDGSPDLEAIATICVDQQRPIEERIHSMKLYLLTGTYGHL